MEEKTYIDGTIFFADSLEFLPVDRVLELPKAGPKICKMDLDFFKGHAAFKGKEIHQILLQRWESLGNLSLIFIVIKYTQLEWTKLRRIFFNAVELAITEMLGTKSYQHWKTVLSKNTYQKIFDKGYGDKASLNLIIFGEDVKAFSRNLIRHVRAGFSGNFPAIDPQIEFCLTILGQNADYHAASKSLQLYNMKCVNTLILHIARDFSQINKCILWDLEKTKTHLMTHRADYFYPGLTIGAGNVYYSLKSGNSENGDYQVSVEKLIKYYSSLCKEVHRTCPLPFKSGVFHKGILQDKFNGSRRTRMAAQMNCFDETLKAIDSVRANIENTVASKKNTARLEVIFVIDKPDISTVSSTFEKFEADFGDVAKLRLVVLDFDDLVTQINKTIYPVLHTLHDIVASFKTGRNGNRYYMMTFGKFFQFIWNKV